MKIYTSILYVLRNKLLYFFSLTYSFKGCSYVEIFPSNFTVYDFFLVWFPSWYFFDSFKICLNAQIFPLNLLQISPVQMLQTQIWRSKHVFKPDLWVHQILDMCLDCQICVSNRRTGKVWRENLTKTAPELIGKTSQIRQIKVIHQQSLITTISVQSSEMNDI
jgi:hypothetical protein